MKIVLDLQGAQSDSRFRGIGRYSIALAQAIAREARDHELWLVLSGRFPESIEPLRAQFESLLPRDRIRVFQTPGPVAELEMANAWRMQAAELLRENFLADLQPDLVHVSTLFEGAHNETVASVGRLDSTVPTAVTLYDLIPLLHPESYLPTPPSKRAYSRRVQSVKRADLLLAISEFSRQEAVEKLPFPESRIVNIAAGVDPSFCRLELSPEQNIALLARFNLQRPFVLYTGGLDPRKNLEGLIAAFSLLPKALRAGYQIAVTSQLHPGEAERIAKMARQHGLASHEVVCIGYASDHDLRSLYNTCTVFVFPSVHEGFGLPLVEAMACGAPVLGSDCTSIPEIINRQDALFDPKDVHAFAERLKGVLANPALRQDLAKWGQERARIFTWETSARTALSAFEAFHAGRVAVSRTPASFNPGSRPLLAFVVPPSTEPGTTAAVPTQLLANLAGRYEISCVLDPSKMQDPWIASNFAVRNISWFETNAGRFDRVLYWFGAGSIPRLAFELLRKCPGVVDLAEFYLGNVLDGQAEISEAAPPFQKALYDSHGYPALVKAQSAGRDAAIKLFPCNAEVLRDSLGVIVHAGKACELTRQWFGDRAVNRLRFVAPLPLAPARSEREAVRKRLGFPENAFVVCSFGSGVSSELNDRLREAWRNSPLAEDERCRLIFVVSDDGDEHEQVLLAKTANAGEPLRIGAMGIANGAQSSDYLSAADLGVQLRPHGWSMVDNDLLGCLSRGVPVLTNVHGSAAELPDDAVFKLSEEFTNESLSGALVRLYREADLRQRIAQQGRSYLNREHQSERMVRLYSEALEEFYGCSAAARESRLIKAIARSPAPVGPAEADLMDSALALASNRDRFGLPQMLVDITILAKFDNRTGIQRVTRGILKQLLLDPPPGYRVEPIRAVTGGYVYARNFTCGCLGLPDIGLVDDPIEVGHRDTFLGLDWCADVVPPLREWFLEHRRKGLRLIFLAYDVLPLMRPEFFMPHIPPIAVEWNRTVAEVADGVVCISRTVADELYQWLKLAGWTRLRPMGIGYFHLGADLHASLPSTGLPADSVEFLRILRSRPSFLMVGTLEPRKGYRQAFAAMELLWASGTDANLVIIGKEGWMMSDLAEKLRQHPEYGHRLLWLTEASDEMLEQVYRSAGALLAPSEGEGFGLPLIEAAQYGLPIIARDLAVFQEVAGEHAYYFHGQAPEALADALRTWLALGESVPSSTGLPWQTWKQSSKQLLRVVLDGQWEHSWPEAALAPQTAGFNQHF